ncbi:MAG: CPBP family intramembrane metalloprotease, partial [Planctomycetaceae bacterium]|nr:CPBP family intramembrane metalloprotease [Planctomycetaceae bacterium]
MSLLLIPSLVYLSRYDQGHWADRMGLIANWRRGLVVGASVSLLWFIPQFIGRSTDAVFDATDLTAGIWLNAIFGSPFAEELLYRQIVLRNLSERFPLWVAVAASAFWFTLL